MASSSGDYNFNSLLSSGARAPAQSFGFLEGDQRNLECPVCRKVAVAPLMVCQTGHTVCESCFKRFQNCPICHDKFAQALVPFAEVKCLNPLCQDVYQVGNLKDHMDACEFRPIVCTTCPTRVNIGFADYPAHLLRHRCSHGELPELNKVCFAISWTGNGQFTDKVWTPYPFLQREIQATFLLNMELRASVFSIWVSAMLSEAEASHYFTELKIGEELEYAKPQNYMNWTVNVGAVHKSLDQIRNSKDRVLSIPMHSVLGFLRISDRELGAAFMFVSFQVCKNEFIVHSPTAHHNNDELLWLTRHIGEGDTPALPEPNLGPLYDQLKEREQEILSLKEEFAESVVHSKEQHKNLKLELDRIEDRLNYRSCCSVQ